MDQVLSHLEFIWLVKLCSKVNYPNVNFQFQFRLSGYFGPFLSNGWAKISETFFIKK